MKNCKKCGDLKADHEFYASRSDCKDCAKAAVRANYARNREHYREYERSRALLPHRVEARREYQATERGKERCQAAQRAFAQRNAGKRAAHVAVGNAVRDGRIWRSPCCTAPGCFSQKGLHAHHTHYDNPLSVVWLCAACHRRLHRDFDAKHGETHAQAATARLSQ